MGKICELHWRWGLLGEGGLSRWHAAKPGLKCEWVGHGDLEKKRIR